MAQKAKKPTPPQKKKPAGKPVKPVKTAPKKSSGKPTKPAKPAPRVQPAKPSKPTKPAKPAKSSKPVKVAKPAARSQSKPASKAKSAAPAKSVKSPKPVKPAKSAKPIPPTVLKKPAGKQSPALKSAPKTAVKSNTPKPVSKLAPKPAPVAKPVTKSAPPVKKPIPSIVPSLSKPEKTVVTSVETKGAGEPKATTSKERAKDDLRSRILQQQKKGPARPIAFSLDEIREIAKTSTKQEIELKATTAKVAAKTTKQIDAAKLEKNSQPHHIKAASLADILGFNPKKKQVAVDETDSIPEKFRRYYKLLIELRNHLTGQIDTHSEETLKRSSKDDAGDLSSYGQHMADAGTDTFDRDFALSLVSSEQEALSEVEAAIQRIKDGSYGICENTQKPIAKERLVAVPFTRYSAEAQKDIEKNRMRSRTQAGLFGELGEEGGTLSPGSGGDDGDE